MSSKDDLFVNHLQNITSYVNEKCMEIVSLTSALSTVGLDRLSNRLYDIAELIIENQNELVIQYNKQLDKEIKGQQEQFVGILSALVDKEK